MLLVGVVVALLGLGLDGPSRASGGTVTVTGTVLEGVTGIESANVQLSYLFMPGTDQVRWERAGGEPVATDEDGKFTITLPTDLLVEGRYWVLTVSPPLAQDGTTGVPARGVNLFRVDALGPTAPAAGVTTVAAGPFTLQAPDVVGRVFDYVGEDVALANAFVSPEVDVEVPVSFDSTRTASVQLPMFAGTTSAGDPESDEMVGHFAFRRPVAVDFPEAVRPFLAPSGTGKATQLGVISFARPDLITFRVDLSGSGDTPEPVRAEFPTPDVTGRLQFTPDGGGAKGVGYFIERLVPASEDAFGTRPAFWEFAGTGGGTFDGTTFTVAADDGKFALVLPAGEGPFRIFFDVPPSGGPYAAFSFEVPAPGSRLDLVVSYPQADLFGAVDLGEEGRDLQSTSGVVTVQRLVIDPFGSRWEWTDTFGRLSGEGPVRNFVLAGGPLAGGLNVPNEQLRLRVTIFEGPQDELGFVVPMPGATPGVNRGTWLAVDGSGAPSFVITPPTPNLTGTVKAGTSSDAPGLGRISVELRRLNATFGFWDWTDVQAVTRDDGRFSLVVPEELLGDTLELRVRPLPRTFAADFVPAFSVPLVTEGTVVAPGGALTDLDIRAIAAPLRGSVCFPGCDGTVSGAWVQLERAVDTPFGRFWDWTEGFATSTESGRFAIGLPGADPDASYRLRVFPPRLLVGDLVEFTVELPGPGVDHPDVTLEFPSPNIGGSLVDADGARVAGAWVNLHAWSDTLGGWEWITSAETRGPRDGQPGGVFLMSVDAALLGDRPLRLDVRNPVDRDDLVPFQLEFALAPSGPTVLSELTFPAPNIVVDVTGTLGGTPGPVPYAFAWLERILPGGRTEQLDIWQSTGLTGRLALRIAEAGDYRMHVHAPWGVDLPTFQQDFSVAAGGIVSGLPATLTFPTPNLTVAVAGPSGAVRFAHLEIRRVDPDTGEEQWLPQNGTTDRSGNASLALEPGVYRVYVTPPWFDTTLSLAVVEVTVPASGATSASVTLRPPNLRGTLDQGAGAESGAWIEVVPPSGASPVPGVYVDVAGPVAGEFRIALPDDGEYRLIVWPGRGNAASTPLEVLVTVSGGEVTAWRYVLEAAGVDRCPDTGACEAGLSFTDPAVAPNFGGTVLRGGVAVEGAFVNVIATGAGSAGTPEGWRAVAVTGADGTFRLRIPTDVEVELVVAVTQGNAVLIAEPPGTFDTSSGLGGTFQVGGLLRALGTPPAGSVG